MMTVMIAQFGLGAVGRKNVMGGGRVANWTGEHSTKTLRAQATLKDRGQKSQGWD